MRIAPFLLLLPFAAFAQTPGKKILSAGPFSVMVPGTWASTAVIEKVPIKPLYPNEKEWRASLTSQMFWSKPGYYNRPQHWAIRLPGADVLVLEEKRGDLNDDPTAPQILIHKADEWNLAFTDGIHDDKKLPDFLQRYRRQLGEWLVKDFHESPGYVEGHLEFICLKCPLAFNGGHGIRMVGQWVPESNILRRGLLHYLFLGFSDDNSCQIIATFPLDCPGLPTEARDAEHLGRSTQRFGELEENYESYQAEAKRWIEEREKEFTPKLATLDEMLRSLSAAHWR